MSPSDPRRPDVLGSSAVPVDEARGRKAPAHRPGAPSEVGGRSDAVASGPDGADPRRPAPGAVLDIGPASGQEPHAGVVAPGSPGAVPLGADDGGAGAGRAGSSRRTVVVKVGTSSLTDEQGTIDEAAVAKVCAEIAAVRADGCRVVAVTSGAIAAGLPVLGLEGRRPRDPVTLQALSAVGQSRLMGVWDRHLAAHGLIGGQVLLAPLDFAVRDQYLHARATLARLLELGVVPVVNENDAVADDEIRFGDNDRIAALVAHLVGAHDLVLLTDTAGVLTADPRFDSEASLIEEIVEVDHGLEALAGGAGTARGSGGMATKLAAAKIASWSGVRTVIAAAHRPGVVADALADVPGVGTVVRPRSRRLSARKLWIAFAVGSSGTVVVDAGARRALEASGRSLLPAGVVGVRGTFLAGDAVEIADDAGAVFAKGIVGLGADALGVVSGVRTAELPEGTPHEVVHRDDLVVLPS